MLSQILSPTNLGDSAVRSVKTNEVPQDLFNGMKTIVGRPYAFLPNADPGVRTFTRHMLPTAPLVMLRPGRVKFSKSIEEYVENALKAFGRKVDPTSVKDLMGRSRDSEGRVVGGIFSNLYGVDDADVQAISKAIDEKQAGTVRDFFDKNAESIRYFEFNSDQEVMKDFQSVLNTLSSRLYSRMNDKALSWLDVRGDFDPAKRTNAGFYTFWADNATSVSESANSEVGSTKLAGLVKGVSAMAREAQFFLGSNKFGGDKVAKDRGMIEGALNGVSEFIGGSDTAGLQASLGQAVLGMNPMFPEVWKDSSFDRSYTLNFKFHTPYGNPAAVYQDVLLPFTMLLSLVMPVQTQPGVYSEPFIFQLDVPGYFACDLGICTNFSFTRGGNDNLWTVDGLPRQIDVNMSVKDLYPILTASKNNEAMYFNIGMGTFLDNLAGISLFKSDRGQADLITRMRAGTNSLFRRVRAMPENWTMGAQDFAQQYLPTNAVSSLFRSLNG
jgi:hypothetical protein